MKNKNKLILIILLASIIFIIGGIIVKYIDDNSQYESSFIKDNQTGNTIIEKLRSSKLIDKYKEDGYEIKVQNVTTSIAIRIKKETSLILRFSLENDYLVANYDKDNDLKYKIITFVIASLEDDQDKVNRILSNNILESLTKEQHGVEIKNNKVYIYFNNLNVKNFNMNLEED